MDLPQGSHTSSVFGSAPSWLKEGEQLKYTNSLKPASSLMAEIEAARSEGVNGAEDDVYFVSVSYRGTAYDVPAPLICTVEFFFSLDCLKLFLLATSIVMTFSLHRLQQMFETWISGPR